MKKIRIPVAGLILVISFLACKKDESTIGTSLTASKSSLVKRGEPVLFTMTSVGAGSSVNWTIQPSTNAQITANGNQASIKFSQKGAFTITGTSGSASASKAVSVTDTSYSVAGTPSTTLSFSSGELLKITVSKFDSGSISGLLFSVVTTNSYTCLQNSLLSVATHNTNSFTFDYTGVLVPSGCTSGTAKAGTFNAFFPASGTNTLTINFNGTSYTGTIVKTGSSYTINWPNSTKVQISPMSL